MKAFNVSLQGILPFTLFPANRTVVGQPSVPSEVFFRPCFPGKDIPTLVASKHTIIFGIGAVFFAMEAVFVTFAVTFRSKVFVTRNAV